MQNKDVAGENFASSHSLHYRCFSSNFGNFITIAPYFFCIQNKIRGKSRKRILVSENHDVLQPHLYSTFSQNNWNSHYTFFTWSMKAP